MMDSQLNGGACVSTNFEQSLPDPAPQAARRTFARWPFEQGITAVPLGGALGGELAFALVCRNLSAGGLGGFSRLQLAEGTRVLMVLPTALQGVATATATVVRCEQSRENLYDIGALFDEPIDLEMFVPLDPLEQQYTHEFVAPHMITGRIALLSESAFDRAFFGRVLSHSQASVTCDARPEAIIADAKSLDVLVISSQLNNSHTEDTVLRCMSAGSRARYVLLASDNGPRNRRLMLKLPFASAIVRPLREQSVLSALA
jgi:PilZ domain